MKIDYLIVGQGVAGTALSYTLMKAGKRVCVVENNERKSASRVAAGIFNPITGRKMVKSWYADKLFPALHQFYPELEQFTGAHFFNPKSIFVPFDSQEKQNTWMAQAADPDYVQYIKGFEPQTVSSHLNLSFGGMFLAQSGYVDLPKMLDSYQQKLEEQNLLVKGNFQFSTLKLLEKGIEWNGIEAEKIIFCEGVGAITTNPFFKWLAFRPVKGELLKVRFTNGSFDHIINRGCWILPQYDGTYKVGATYDNHDLSDHITEKARLHLTDKLSALTQLDYQIIDQLVGIRPATYDRRPFVGLHPLYNQVGIFNGLGAKGISLAPYFAQHFVDVLLNQRQLMGLIDIARVVRKFDVKKDVLIKL